MSGAAALCESPAVAASSARRSPAVYSPRPSLKRDANSRIVKRAKGTGESVSPRVAGRTPTVFHTRGRSGAAVKPSEFQILLRELIVSQGCRWVSSALCVPCYVLEEWIGNPKRRVWPSARAHVWLLHAVILRPDRLRSPFDIVTQGRFVT